MRHVLERWSISSIFAHRGPKRYTKKSFIMKAELDGEAVVSSQSMASAHMRTNTRWSGRERSQRLLSREAAATLPYAPFSPSAASAVRYARCAIRRRLPAARASATGDIEDPSARATRALLEPPVAVDSFRARLRHVRYVDTRERPVMRPRLRHAPADCSEAETRAA